MGDGVVDVAIVGGGISGLACAYACHSLGMRVAVYEAVGETGGCIKTVRSGEYLAEGGPQSFLTSPAFTDLVEALGLRGKLVASSAAGKRRYLYTRRGLIVLPMSPFALLVSPLLSAGAKWRLLREPSVPPRTGSEDESIASFVERRVGREIVDTVVGPFVAGIYAGDPERISVRSAFPALERMEREHGSVLNAFRKRATPASRPASISFADGNATLPQAITAALGATVSLRSPVEHITLVPDGVQLAVGGEHPSVVDAKRAVIAVSASAAARLLESVAPAAARELDGIERAPVAQVVLAYPRASVGVPTDGFGFLATRDAGLRILGAVWNSAAFADRCGKDEILLTAFVGGARDRDVAGHSDEDLVALVHSDLRKAMQIGPVKPRAVAGFRWDSGIPQYNLGHEARLRAIDTAMASIPRVALCGNYLRGVSVSDCVRQARELALRLSQEAP